MVPDKGVTPKCATCEQDRPYPDWQSTFGPVPYEVAIRERLLLN